MPSRLWIVAVFVTCSLALQAADTAWLRGWERAQQQRPAQLATKSQIAPPEEPGARMVIHGQVLQTDGTPLADAVVFAYHTDRKGLYDRRDAGPHSWRLRGWALTDASGRFEFDTIRPAEYPGGNAPPAHVHFTITAPDGKRYFGRDLHPDEVTARRDHGADHVEHVLKLEQSRTF
jgi:protocatechuate 3,4-dioxygenase beta subunit